MSARDGLCLGGSWGTESNEEDPDRVPVPVLDVRQDGQIPMARGRVDDAR